eukprot:scaffold18.g2003.t1
MQALYIRRHDSAVRKIHAALQKGSPTGSAYTVLDACRQDQLAELHADAKRLPAWLLPDTASEEVACMRPDVLRVTGLPPAPTAAEIEAATQNKHRHPIQVVEVGYCSDTRWGEKVQDKLAQHRALLEALAQAGWRVDPDPHIVVLGACGAVYLNGLQALKKLGLTKEQSSTLLTKLHVMATQAVHDILVARRRLERGRPAKGEG